MRYFSRKIGAAVCMVMLTACQAQPNDAPTVEGSDSSDKTQNQQSTPSSTSPTQKEKKEDFSSPYAKEIVIGVDDVGHNLNPHLIGSNSPVTDAIASLILPSAFRERSGAMTLNSDLLQEATVVQDASTVNEEEAAPTHVRYVITPSAQWSDGTPISGTDFRYLWEELRTQSGVSGATGYGMIKDIEISKAGRQIDVYFSHPYVPWKELFSNLLPSHIYRTESRDFTDMMMDDVAASGGNYTLEKVDSARGIIELIRNDRFYGENQALTEKITFQRLSSDDAAAQMMRTGQIQMYYATPRAVSSKVMDQVPHTVVTAAERPKNLILNFNQSSERMNVQSMRERVIQAIDRETLAEIVTRVPGTKVPPFQISHIDSTPAPHESESFSMSASSTPTEKKEEDPVVIAAPTTDNAAIAAARTVSDQLDRAGISSTVDLLKPAELFGGKLVDGSVDMVVNWQNDTERLSSIADQYRCLEKRSDQHEKDQDNNDRGEEKDQEEGMTATFSIPSSSALASSSAIQTTAETTVEEPAEEKIGIGANITGFCDSGMNEILNRALSGELSDSEVRSIVQRTLEEKRIILPLLSADIFWAVNTDLYSPRSINVPEGNEDVNGPFSDAARWTYPPEQRKSE